MKEIQPTPLTIKNNIDAAKVSMFIQDKITELGEAKFFSKLGRFPCSLKSFLNDPHNPSRHLIQNLKTAFELPDDYFQLLNINTAAVFVFCYYAKYGQIKGYDTLPWSLKQLCEIFGYRKLMSRACALTKEPVIQRIPNRLQKYTDEELLNLLREFHLQHGRAPYYYEIKLGKTIISRFFKPGSGEGGWTSALKLVGLTPSPRTNERRKKQEWELEQKPVKRKKKVR